MTRPILLLMLWLLPIVAWAQTGLGMPVDVCPVRADESVPPAQFDRPDCERLPLYRVDPQGRHLWLRMQLQPDAPESTDYLGLLIAAKASSELYIGGELIGRNGLPGADARSEIAGRMDVVLPLDRARLRAADHAIVLRMSSQQGWLQLVGPIHAIELVGSPDVQNQTLRYYLPSLLPLGVFLLAAFYFGSLTLRSERKLAPALLTALALLAAMQLLLEVSRGVLAYAYPMHDLRLLGILGCAGAFGLGLVALLTHLYAPRRLAPALVLAALAMTTVLALTGAMDSRTALMLLIGSLIALAAALLGVRRGARGARAYAAGLALFALADVVDPSGFIDYGFYWLVALLMVGLMVLQAAAYSRERRLQLEQRVRADRLQRALEQVQAERQPQVLTVPGTGQLRQIAVDRIVRIQGAGDYVELHLDDGSQVLHTATLNELDAELPPNFLRVHRSHLVNTRHIDRLERSEGGTGTLHLRQGQTVPVSRRVMPGVRRALR
ncbi:MAG: LytTR family DNA-binding domain-containing protein [Lysobacteraceae bacterium]